MIIHHLSLTNFRNYARLELDLGPGITLFQGDNAQGKSNLLESIYYLATSRSPQTNSDAELVNWLVRSDALAFSRLVGDIQWGGDMQHIELTLAPASNDGRAGTPPNFRRFVRINGIPKRAMDLIGLVNVVIFRPQDIELVSDGPGVRRHYLDAMLCQLHARYCRTLQGYNRILNQRNCLLRQLRERGGSEDQLVFWDQRLAEHGAYITACRQEALERLDALSHPIHLEITEHREQLRLSYQPSCPVPPSLSSGRPDQPSLFTPGLGDDQCGWVHELALTFLDGLQRLRREEIARGVTLVGPHRDDFRFVLADADLTIYGSRGQQRTAALAVKLAETTLVQQVRGRWPILLLDDVMSELDGQRRQRLMELIDGASQTLMTTTHIDAYSVSFLNQVKRYQIKDGRLETLGGDTTIRH
jgi:DNA replication and repair protein RecF